MTKTKLTKAQRAQLDARRRKAETLIGKLISPRDLGAVNRWLKTQPWATDGETTAQLARHYERDGGQLYWHSYPGPMFYTETVECIRRADDMTYREWEQDYRERVGRAERGF